MENREDAVQWANVEEDGDDGGGDTYSLCKDVEDVE